MAKWKVREGYQVKHDGKHYVGGETFEAPASQVSAFGDLVSEVRQQSQPKAANKAQPAPKPAARKK
jgi:hypothetical protein